MGTHCARLPRAEPPAADLPASSQPPAATTIIFQPTADLPVAYSASILHANATADLPVAYSASIFHANSTADLPVAYSGSIGKCFLSPCCLSTGRACAELFPEASNSGRADRADGAIPCCDATGTATAAL